MPETVSQAARSVKCIIAKEKVWKSLEKFGNPRNFLGISLEKFGNPGKSLAPRR
jgi:hypothetical protein